MLKIEKKKQKCLAFVEGEIGVYNISDYKDLFVPLLSEDKDIVVNLEKVTEIDSAGIQLLMMLKKEQLLKGKVLTLVGHSSVLLEVFEIMGLVSYFNDPVVLPK